MKDQIQVSGIRRMGCWGQSQGGQEVELGLEDVSEHCCNPKGFVCVSYACACVCIKTRLIPNETWRLKVNSSSPGL